MSGYQLLIGQYVELQLQAHRDDDVLVPPTDIPVWTSSNPAVANIRDGNPLGTKVNVVGLSVGTAVITVTSMSLSATFTVSVSAPPTPTINLLSILAGTPVTPLQPQLEQF